MAISCAYCNGEHASPQEVRQCWTDGGQKDVPLSTEDSLVPFAGQPDDDQLGAYQNDPAPAVSRPTMGRGRPSSKSTERVRSVIDDVARGVALAGPGPDALGRCVIVQPGAQADDPWASADRLVVTSRTLTEPAEALARLRAAHHAAERLVIEVEVDFDRQPMLMTDAAPYELGATFAFELEELYHLVWANSIDMRDPDKPTWIVLDMAIARGATTVAPDDSGDVLLPGGQAVWLDGGPVRHVPPIGGVGVLHLVAVEHGSLATPGPNESSADLADDQLAAVTHAGGGARIIAPAGSGKTRVLTERARHLVQQWNLPPSAVSLVAFNKRAQEEMKERTSDIAGLQVRTLNAMALAIVNGVAPFAPQQQSWRTIDEPDVRRIIGNLVSFPRRRNSDPIGPWIEALSVIRLGLVDPDEAEIRYDGDVKDLAETWPRYREALERKGAVDFDDQIYRALLVLLSDPVARRTAQRACRIMLVDEFQDLTPAHLLMIRLLSCPGGAVFGVGDDDQTIYGYNGADPAWLIDFAQLFPGAGEHPLEVNYRCPAGIVDIVDRLLRHNTRRVHKSIRAASSDTHGWSVDNDVDVVGATKRAVESALESGADASDIAVLTRVNALLAPVQVALATAGVPVSGGVGLEFTDRTSVRAVLAWIRLATGGRSGRLDPDDIREALRRPSRSFHPRITDWIAEQRSLVDLNKLAGRLNKQRDSERLIEFAADIQVLQQMVKGGSSTSDVLFTLIDQIGLAGSVAGLDANRHGMNRSAQGDDLTAIQHLAALHDDPATFEGWLRDHLAIKRSSNGVVLSTVHRVKGQEWPYVIVHLADAEQYPHRLADDVEEERRLFHVAITRASTHATISTGQRPSPFVADLTTEPSANRIISTHRPEVVAAKTSKAGPTDPMADLDAAGAQRYEALRGLRNELRDGKPAYVVFDNKTLAAIAKNAPISLSELSRISGVGPAKLDKYGDSVIALVARLTTS